MGKRKIGVVWIIVVVGVFALGLVAVVFSLPKRPLNASTSQNALDVLKTVITIVGALLGGAWAVYRYWLAPSDAWSVDLGLTVEPIFHGRTHALLVATATMKNVSSVRLHLVRLELEMSVIDPMDLIGLPQCVDTAECFRSPSPASGQHNSCGCGNHQSLVQNAMSKQTLLKKFNRIGPRTNYENYILEPNTTYVERFVEPVPVGKVVQVFVQVKETNDALPIDVRQILYVDVVPKPCLDHCCNA